MVVVALVVRQRRHGSFPSGGTSAGINIDTSFTNPLVYPVLLRLLDLLIAGCV